MKRQSIRVVLASEDPGIRSVLRGAIETESKAVIVGQAENAAKALTLARNLRPDVAIIDSYLPHSVGVKMMPLSRIGGLDAAQTISAEIPEIRVVLLNSLEGELSLEGKDGVGFCHETNQACVPFTLDDLQTDRVVPLGAMVFAHVIARPRGVPARKTLRFFSEKAMFLGGVSVICGGILIVTIFLSGAGVYLAGAGAVAWLAGAVGKLISRLLK